MSENIDLLRKRIVAKKSKKLPDNRKCRYGKSNCILYDGKRITYNTKKELSNKLIKMGVPKNNVNDRVNELLNNNTVRTITAQNGENITFDIRTDFKGLLRQKFNKQRISNKAVINGGDMAGLNINIGSVPPRLARIKSSITFILYISFPSELCNIYKKDDLGRNIKDENGKEVLDNAKLRIAIRNGLYEADEQYNGQVVGRINTRKVENVIFNDINAGLEKWANDKALQLSTIYTDIGAEVKAWQYYQSSTLNNELQYKSKYYVGDEEKRLEEWANIEYLGGDWIYGKTESCAVRFVTAKFPEYYWDINKLETPQGVSCEDFENFCNHRKIYYKFCNISGEVVSTNENLFIKMASNKINENFKSEKFDIDRALSQYKYNLNQCLCAIIYNNHIYPYSGGKLIKVANKPQKTKRVKNIQKKFNNIMESGTVPRNVKMDIVAKGCLGDEPKFKIVSFIHKGVKYFENPEYKKWSELLKKMRITEKIPTSVSLMSIPNIILKAKKEKYNVLSFIPDKELYKMKALAYETTENVDINDIEGIDKNKCFPWALANLPYLIRHDWRKHNVNVIDGKLDNYTDHFIYLVKCKEYNILLPQSGLYTGKHLNHCKMMGISFKVFEEFETEICHNFYADLFRKLYKYMDPNDFKKMAVILIGIQEKSMSKKSVFKLKSISHDDDNKIVDGYKFSVDDYVYICDFKETITNVRDNLPINIQLKEAVFREIHRKIIELDLNDSDIVQIKTDSIIHKTKNKTKYTPDELVKLRLDFDGWKPLNTDEYKPVNSFKENYKNDRIAYKTTKLVNINEERRIIHTQYAGNGKTTYIVNKLVPWAIYNKKTYQILTPSHSTLVEYKDMGLVCEIIHYYCYNNTIPKEDFIIIDEIGFCDASAHDLLYKLNQAHKSFECFGDFNQLLPVGELLEYNQPHYLKYMFNEIDSSFINYRNNFTKEYYDSLINSNDGNYLLNEVHKYSTDMYTADVCICFRKEVREFVNKQILLHLKLSPYSVGTRLICHKNDLGNEYGIWNHTEVTVIDSHTDGYYQKTVGKKRVDDLDDPIVILTLKTPTGKVIDLDKNIVMSKFRHAYCLNIYEAQGKTFNSYHWVKDDDVWLKNYKDKNRIAYVLISRLREKVDNKYLLRKKLENDVKRVEKIENNRKIVEKNHVDDFNNYNHDDIIHNSLIELVLDSVNKYDINIDKKDIQKMNIETLRILNMKLVTEKNLFHYDNSIIRDNLKK